MSVQRKIGLSNVTLTDAKSKDRQMLLIIKIIRSLIKTKSNAKRPFMLASLTQLKLQSLKKQANLEAQIERLGYSESTRQPTLYSSCKKKRNTTDCMTAEPCRTTSPISCNNFNLKLQQCETIY